MNNTLLPIYHNIATNSYSFEKVSLLIALGSLVAVIIFNIIMICKDLSTRKLKLFHDVRKELLEIAYKIKQNLPESEKQLWDHKLLNCTEYIAFLVRKGKVKYKYVKEFLGEAIIDCYEEILIKRYKKDYKNPKMYEELKRLYEKLK